jgi:hypothetical protein
VSNPNHPGGPPTTPPGWYPDGQGGQRWWDGTAWTQHTQPPPPPVPPQQPAGPTGPPPGAPPQQGGYPQQQWQPGPGGYPQQRQGGISGKLIGIIGGAAVAVIALVVVLVLVVGGGSSGPEGVVEDFLSAQEDMDCGALEDLATDTFIESTFGSVEACEEAADQAEGSDAEVEGMPSGDVDYDVQEAEVDGDSATVEVDITAEIDGDEQELTQTFELAKDGDDWKIDSIS